MGQSMINLSDVQGEEIEQFQAFHEKCKLHNVEAYIDRDHLTYWIAIMCHKNVVINGEIEDTLKFPIRVPAISMANTEDVCLIAFEQIKRLIPMIDKGFIDEDAGRT